MTYAEVRDRLVKLGYLMTETFENVSRERRPNTGEWRLFKRAPEDFVMLNTNTGQIMTEANIGDIT